VADVERRSRRPGSRGTAPRNVAGRSHRLYSLYFRAEQTPNPTSRVSLSERLDALGTPEVKLDWRVSTSDIDAIPAWLELLDADVRARGLGRVIAPPEGWDRGTIGGIDGSVRTMVWASSGSSASRRARTLPKNVRPRRGVVNRPMRVAEKPDLPAEPVRFDFDDYVRYSENHPDGDFELLGGAIYKLAPEGDAHLITRLTINTYLHQVLDLTKCTIGTEGSFPAPGWEEGPKPDNFVSRGALAQTLRRSTSEDLLLVIEITSSPNPSEEAELERQTRHVRPRRDSRLLAGRSCLRTGGRSSQPARRYGPASLRLGGRVRPE
jgi:hypothetical protein